jgi:hypothetical protein
MHKGSNASVSCPYPKVRPNIGGANVPYEKLGDDIKFINGVIYVNIQGLLLKSNKSKLKILEDMVCIYKAFAIVITET